MTELGTSNKYKKVNLRRDLFTSDVLLVEQSVSLLDLPAEIHNQIHGDTIDLSDQLHPFPLANACRQVSIEASAVRFSDVRLLGSSEFEDPWERFPSSKDNVAANYQSTRLSIHSTHAEDHHVGGLPYHL